MSLLRNALQPHVLALKDRHSHKDLSACCEELGLPSCDTEGSKAERIKASFEALPNSELPRLAENIIKLKYVSPVIRNEIQDLLWAGSPIDIPKKIRHDIARALTNVEIYNDAKGFDQLMNRLWILDNDSAAFWGGPDNSLRFAIDKHVHRNPGDWSHENLFTEIGAFEASNKRFALFIEGLSSPDVRPDEGAQRSFVQLVNKPLGAGGIELRETSSEGGYPLFRIVSKGASSMGRPKNLIFASPQKPDLRFRNAVDNDIEIVTNSDKVLVYDRPIGADGLLWRDLQSWWSETNNLSNDDVSKETLYRRLQESLPDNSPPQALLFNSYHKAFGKAIPNLPALLPEVWLHWDPKTVKDRGRDALLRFRMDFLLLMPSGIRVVIEVDGKQHYATEDGRADPSRYAEMVAGDRDLQLSGYQVYRFGAAELQPRTGFHQVQKFFASLFKLFGISVPSN